MRVLLAVDLMSGRASVLREAEQWVVAMKATVDLVYVREGSFDPDSVHDAELRQVLATRASALEDADRGVLLALLEQVPDGHRGTVWLRTGSIAEAIVELGDDYDAIVVGTHGRQGLSRFWLGSVAEKVLRLARKPVLVVPIGETSGA